MTIDEAIKMLKSKMNGHTDTSYEWTETVRMAIKALEQEPCDECKYKTFTELYFHIDPEMVEQEPCDKCKYFDGNSCQHYDYKVGYTQGYEDASKPFRQEPCDDVVSRQAVLDIVNNPLNIRLDEIIKKLPSVRPQEQTGHWIKYPHNSGIVVCNQCKGIRRDCRVGYTNYCNRCGAKMVEPQESEVEE